MTRDEAIAAGFVTYAADKPCRLGHAPAIRYASSGNCVACLGLRRDHQARLRTRAALGWPALVARVPPEHVDAWHLCCEVFATSGPARDSLASFVRLLASSNGITGLANAAGVRELSGPPWVALG